MNTLVMSNLCYFADTKDLNGHIGEVKPLLFFLVILGTLMNTLLKSNLCNFFGDTRDLNEHIGEVKPLYFFW